MASKTQIIPTSYRYLNTRPEPEIRNAYGVYDGDTKLGIITIENKMYVSRGLHFSCGITLSTPEYALECFISPIKFI